MKRNVYVPMRPEDAATLVRLAQAEFRRPSDHAAWLLREALKQATQAERPDRQPAEVGA
jgi:hypothetical protein